MFARKPFTTALIALGLVLPLTARADDAALRKSIDALAAQLRALQDAFARVRQDAHAAMDTANGAAVTAKQSADSAAAAAKVVAAAPPPAPVATAAGSQAPYAFPQVGPNTVLSSYGEIQYDRPKNDSGAIADVGRFVIALSHSFDEKTRMAAEFEVEHAVSSANDRGEAEVEQAYIEHDFTDSISAKAGLFLMPVGLLNEHHEPTVYYGVYRNFVETAIIPTTWREIGIGGQWRAHNGISVEGGLTTGFDLSKWDPNSDEGRESPLGSIHQEGQLALARDLSVYGALNWRGIPGLQVGGSIFHGGAGQGQNFPASHARITMYEGHTRWTPGKWDLSALYARGQIADTGALNAAFTGAPTPVPSTFSGWYTQAAYRQPLAGDGSVGPFVRYEQWNTAQSYVGLPQGFDKPTGPHNNATTIGLNYWLNPGVVFKLDYQWLRPDSTQTRLDLGVGYSF